MAEASPESVVAEKLHSMATLGIVGTPLEDYYTVWRLSTERVFTRRALTAALRDVFGRHGTGLPKEVPDALAGGYVEYWDPGWQPLAVKLEVGRNAPPLGEVLADLRAFLVPVLADSAHDAGPDADWTPGEGWYPRA